MITDVIGSPDSDPPFAGDFGVACWRAGGGTGDPLTTFQSFFGPVETSTGNYTNFVHPEIDDALETLRSSDEFDDRYAAVETISRISAENVALVWNVGSPMAIGYRDDIHGIPSWTFPDGTPGRGVANATARFHQVFIAE